MLYQMLSQTVEKFADNTALVYGSLRMSYQELGEQVCGFSHGLSSLGVKEGDCVALVLPNTPEFVISFYAIARLNAIALLLNPAFKASELKHYFQDSNTRVVITDAPHADICAHVIGELEQQIDLIVVGDNSNSGILFHKLIKAIAKEVQEIPRYGGDLLYQYSSGSTGRPKRVCRTQKNVFHQAQNSVQTLEVQASDRFLCIVPLFHAYGFGECLLAATASGATLVILEPFLQDGIPVEMPFVFRHPRVVELLEQEKITILPAVPYIYSILATTPDHNPVDWSSLRLCISAGNFLSEDIFSKFLHRFNLPIRQLYGCTEAGAVTVNLQSGTDIKYNSVGLPMHNVEIKVIGDQGDELPHGVVGELVIKSQTLTKGYYNATELNQQAFQNGHFFTGDLGKKDEEGYIYITGRKKLFIDTGGHKVDPFEVEDLIQTHPSIQEVVVVGTKRPYTGEILKAVVVSQGECSEEELINYCKEKLADFKVPRIVEFRDEIPKSPLGKILRKDLV